MTLKIGPQLGFAFAVPIVAIAAIAAFLWYEFGAIDTAQRTASNMANLQTSAHDAVLQEYLNRFGLRGAVLTLKPGHFQMLADSRAASIVDFAALAAYGACIPEISGPVAEALPIVRRIMDRDDVLGASAKQDRNAVLDGFIGLTNTRLR